MIAVVFTLLACSGDKDASTVTDVTADTGTTAVAAHRVLGEGANLPPAALLSVWGSSAEDVWIVGADDGSGPVLLHFDGADWERVETGTSGDLWWVWGDSAGTLFLSGAGGRVLTLDINSGVFTEHAAADPNLTLFGMWGTSATDVWTVGGSVDGVRNGAMIHYDGTDWTEMGQPDGETFRATFKVWGRATNDVWFVGQGALVSHWDGSTFTEVTPTPVYETTTLTTVAGDADQVIAVGGFGNAVVARNDGSGFVEDSPPPAAIAPGLNGVNVRDGQVVACGVRGAVWTRTEAEGWAELAPSATNNDLHGCWIDPDGHVWSVGGDLISLTAGVVLTDSPEVPTISL